MPVNISNKNLPAAQTLTEEGIFVMNFERAEMQDIRPLNIAILNIMPTKEKTETQLLRLLSNTPLQVEITLLHPETHRSKNTSEKYLKTFYSTFKNIRDKKFDGLIITGAPIEHIEFEEVTYWEELTEIMEWSKTNVFSTMHICWGAQAGLYYHYGVPKHELAEKLFGVFPHTCHDRHIPLLRGYDDLFYAPHSRNTEVRREDMEKIKELTILCESPESGVYIATGLEGRQVFITGHPEYDRGTLKEEYLRDVKKGLDIKVPENYFPENDPKKEPVKNWRCAANLLFYNWLNYYVYQETPFNFTEK